MSTDVLAPERYDQLLIDVKHDLRNSYASVGLETEVAGLQGWKAQLEADGSFGRILNGPQWIDRVAIRDGAVNADKVVAQFIIANEFTTAAGPADRVSLSTAGIQVYGTISAVPNQKVVDFQTSGDFALGDPGGNQITFDIGTGVLEVPAAVIPDLTISNVSAGIVGGNYDSAAANPKIRFSTAGIEAWNSGGTKTFDLKTSDGSITITGAFTVKSAVSGSRVEILNSGTFWYNSGGLRAKILSDGSGFLGSTNGLVSGASISWLTNGSTIINADAITAGDFSADRIFGGTLTIGDITISGTISAANFGGGTLGGGFDLGTQSITIGGTGKLKFGTNALDYLGNDKLYFAVGTGETAKVRFENPSYPSRYGEIAGLGTSSRFSTYLNATYDANNAAQITANSEAAANSGIQLFIKTGTSTNTVWWILHDSISMIVNADTKFSISTAVVRMTGKLYPGTGSSDLGGAYIAADGVGGIDIRLGDAAGADAFYIQDSAPANVWGVNSNGQMIFPAANDASALGSYHGRIGVYVGGSLKYLAAYNA